MRTLAIILAYSSILLSSVTGMAIKVKMEKRTPKDQGISNQGSYTFNKRSPVPASSHTVTIETISNKDLPKNSLMAQLPKEKAHFSLPFIHKREGNDDSFAPLLKEKSFDLVPVQALDDRDSPANVPSVASTNHASLLGNSIFMKRKRSTMDRGDKSFVKRDPNPSPTHFLMPHLAKLESMETTQIPFTKELIIAETRPDFSTEARMRMNRGKQKLILAGDPLIVK